VLATVSERRCGRGRKDQMQAAAVSRAAVSKGAFEPRCLETFCLSELFRPHSELCRGSSGAGTYL